MTQKPWVAEVEVGAGLARALIESQFPQLAPAQLEALPVGWDNTVYRVNSQFVFRFPRRQVAVDLIETESRVLPEIAPRLPLAIPLPTMLGEPARGFPWPFAGYAYIEGLTACVAGLDDDDRRRAAEPLGRFLSALHGINPKRGGLPLPDDTLGRLDFKKRIPKAQTNIEKLADVGLIEGAEMWFDMLNGFHKPTGARPRTLVHGDLYARNLLVDDKKSVSGVIDWGDVHAGDPAVDLSIAHGLLPPDAHDSFRQAYGPIDDETWELARFRALYHALVTMNYGCEIGEESLVREGLVVFRHLAARQ